MKYISRRSELWYDDVVLWDVANQLFVLLHLLIVAVNEHRALSMLGFAHENVEECRFPNPLPPITAQNDPLCIGPEILLSIFCPGLGSNDNPSESNDRPTFSTPIHC